MAYPPRKRHCGVQLPPSRLCCPPEPPPASQAFLLHHQGDVCRALCPPPGEADGVHWRSHHRSRNPQNIRPRYTQGTHMRHTCDTHTAHQAHAPLCRRYAHTHTHIHTHSKHTIGRLCLTVSTRPLLFPPCSLPDGQRLGFSSSSSICGLLGIIRLPSGRPESMPRAASDPWRRLPAAALPRLSTPMSPWTPRVAHLRLFPPPMRAGPYLITIAERRLAGKILGHDIYEVHAHTSGLCLSYV